MRNPTERLIPIAEPAFTKKLQLTPSFRFPLLAGGTEPLRGSPREAGGTYGGGQFMNFGHAIGMRDILDAIANIERYSVRGRGAFEQDELVRIWILYHLQIIGEAAAQLGRGFSRGAP
jgi:hypothetical protein